MKFMLKEKICILKLFFLFLDYRDDKGELKCLYKKKKKVNLNVVKLY